MIAVVRIALLSVLVVLGGCASSEVTAHQPYEGEIERPDRILVYDFAATADELPAEVAVAGRDAYVPSATPSQLEIARELGKKTAQHLVDDLRAAGLPAFRNAEAAPVVPGDGLVVGYFTTVDTGNATKRVTLGFGQGAAQLKTVVKGYFVTADGLQPLGSGEVEAGSGKLPGGAASLIVVLATGNPIGLAVGAAAKAYGELSGSETIEGAAERTAREISDKIEASARRQGWI